jgi:hypothetical protein
MRENSLPFTELCRTVPVGQAQVAESARTLLCGYGDTPQQSDASTLLLGQRRELLAGNGSCCVLDNASICSPRVRNEDWRLAPFLDLR